MALTAAVLLPSTAWADKLYTQGKGGSWDCRKDATVRISANNGTYTFTGACTWISVSGNNNTLTVDTTQTLDVSGNNNTVDTRSADRIGISGNDNKVSHGNADARTANSGRGNTLTAGTGKAAGGGGGGDAEKPAAKRKSAPSGNEIDCASNPTYSISSGAGSYQFVGTCDKIAVLGGENRLTIEAVRELSVAGADNTIDIVAVDKISAVGNDNKIRYKKGLSGARPKVTSLGSGNQIDQAK